MQGVAVNEIKSEYEHKAYYERIKYGAMENDSKIFESVIKERNKKLRILKEYKFN